MSSRKIFKDLVSSEEAVKKLNEKCRIQPVGMETISIITSDGRVIAEDIVSKLDVPTFDRATMDGYAVKASDTFEAKEDQPVTLRISGVSQPGSYPTGDVNQGEAVETGTGSPIPKGANAVVMVEYTQTIKNTLRVFRPVSPGENIVAAGSDIMTGELVLRSGEKITPREIGVLSAIGVDKVKVHRKPIVAIISTGNELAKAGEKLGYAQIYDINSNSISASVTENGGAPLPPIIVRDDEASIRNAVIDGVEKADIILTSGSTSAGSGDIMHKVLSGQLATEIVAHGLTVKPGKPTIIAVSKGKPLIGLPGYPTSALMIFNLIVAPLIRRLAGLNEEIEYPLLDARAGSRIYSAKGRRELLPVQVVLSKGSYVAYPVGLGSGAIMSVALADGYIDVPKSQEFIEENESVKVRLISSQLHPADLVIVGSHCTGIDLLIQHIRKIKPGLSVKIVNAGSLGGVQSIERGEADLAGVHILDEETGEYNVALLKESSLSRKAHLVRGYMRDQGLIIAKGNPKKIKTLEDITLEEIVFINRNQGSGTRLLLDMKLKSIADNRKTSLANLKTMIQGYDTEAKSHSAVAAAVAQGKADVGLGIRTVANVYGLDFIHLNDEILDFIVSKDRMKKEAVRVFLETLKSKDFQKDLQEKMVGLNALPDTGQIKDVNA